MARAQRTGADNLRRTPDGLAARKARAAAAYAADRDAERAKRKAYYDANKQKWQERHAKRRAAGWRRDPEYIRAYRLKQLYNLTLEEYDRLFKAQNGVCAICCKPESVTANLPVDHDHVTGEVRGLLCTPCNTALGLIGESPDRLRVMADYLEVRHR